MIVSPVILVAATAAALMAAGLASGSVLTTRSMEDYVRLLQVPPLKVEARLTGQVELVCSASGSPAPRVAWYLADTQMSAGPPAAEDDDLSGSDGKSMGESVARLVLPCLGQAQAGVYTCRAAAGHHVVEAETEVTVAEYPDTGCQTRTDYRPVISRHSPVLMVKMGEAARLPCRPQAHVDYDVTWANSSEGSIKTDPRFEVEESGDLIIKKVSWDDMGQYTCTLANQYGRDTATTFLYPVSPS